MRGKWRLAAVLAALCMMAPAGATPVPGTTCELLPASNVWHMDVSRLPRHPRSAIWKRAMHAGTTDLHPDFGPPHYGIPFDAVGNAHPTHAVRFRYAEESDAGQYPFGVDTTIEGGSDRHAIIVNRDTCTLYELYAARWNGGDPTAGSGAIFDLTSNALRPVGWTSADAAGLPILPGLITRDEVQAGVVDHAIRFTADCTSRHFLWPARHQAGVADPTCPPMGARFRLKPGFSLAGASPAARTVIAAMKHFGLLLADNGSDWYFQGAIDEGWTNALLDQLKRIPARAFVAVDESACKVAPGSGAFAYGPGCPGPV